jgi:hypothetical protein
MAGLLACLGGENQFKLTTVPLKSQVKLDAGARIRQALRHFVFLHRRVRAAIKIEVRPREREREGGREREKERECVCE